MRELGDDMLKHLASKYIWWKSPEEAMAVPNRIIAQVMNIGDFDDVQKMANLGKNDCARQARQGEHRTVGTVEVDLPVASPERGETSTGAERVKPLGSGESNLAGAKRVNPGLDLGSGLRQNDTLLLIEMRFSWLCELFKATKLLTSKRV